jgi:expansin (peptidoglycan-binding protein)
MTHRSIVLLVNHVLAVRVRHLVHISQILPAFLISAPSEHPLAGITRLLVLALPRSLSTPPRLSSFLLLPCKSDTTTPSSSSKMVRAFSVAVALLSATAAFASADEYFEGDGTSYTLSQVSSGNCNFMSAIPTASTNYVALNQAQWDSLGNCGRCIEVSCIDEQCTVQNKTAVVQVLDRCPECAHGALDLSPTVYKEITGLDPNRLTVRWRFVDCPDPGTVQVCLKEGSNANWIAVQPTNGVVGVESVTVNGATTTMLDGAYYYVSTSSGADLSATKVAITSINGDVISGTYALTAGSCVDTNKQFGSGSSSQSQSTTTSAPKATTATPSATTATPKATTATPSATAETPSTTSPTQTYSSSASEESSYEEDSQTGESSQTDGESQTDQSFQDDSTQGEASSVGTTAPVTTDAPEATTATPEATTATPEAATTDAPTQSDDTSKCRVRSGRRHRN